MRFAQSPISRLVGLLLTVCLLLMAVLALAASRPQVDILIKQASGDRVEARVAGEDVILVALLRHDVSPPAALMTEGDLDALLADDPTRGLRIETSDFIEEPDMLPSYAALNRFLQRQQAIADLLKDQSLRAVVGDASGTLSVRTVPIEASRTFADLGTGFYMQFASAGFILTVASFLVALKPRNRAVLAFAVSGLGVAGSALTAAVYSSRSLALPTDLFLSLSIGNQAMTYLFGISVIYLFAIYPGRLVNWSRLWPVPLLTAAAIFLFRTQSVPIEFVSSHLVILLLLVAILFFVFLQYRAARTNPADRTVMLWLGVSIVIGAGSFALLVSLPLLFGWQGVISQGAAFVPLAAIYAATSIGILRYRLFDLGRWSYRVLLSALIILGVFLLDLAVAYTLRLSPVSSLGIAVLAFGLVYLPLRDYLFDRFQKAREPDLSRLYRETTSIAFQPTTATKEAAWTRLLHSVFEPAQVDRSEGRDGQPGIRDEGLALDVPAYAWTSGLSLRLANGGRRLFDPRDAALVSQLADLVTTAESDRISYDRGVTEERHRIARDLHDDVGAILLSGLHAREESRRQDAILDALADIRQIASGLVGRDIALSQLVGHLRHETRQRAEQHGLLLSWPLSSADESPRVLPYAVHRNLSALHREALSNAIRHGRPGPLTVSLEESGMGLAYTISNDCDPLPERQPGGPANPAGGHGLVNIRDRAARMQALVKTARTADQFSLRLEIPYR